MKYKIIVAGPVGSGKTTAINSLTDNNAFVTDVAVSDEVTNKRKQSTTVAMDFGVVKVNDDTAYVYGTPGQQRFNFMWEILSEGAHGIIILLDNTRNYPFRDLKYYVEQFADLIASQQLIIGVTRSDMDDDVPLSTYKLWLKELKLDAEVRFVDARDRHEVEQLVHALMGRIVSASAIVSPDDVGVIVDEKIVVEEQGLLKEAISESNIIEDAAVIDNVQEEQPDEAALANSSADVLNLDEKTLGNVATLEGVNGVTLTNSIGELLHSTINDDDINEFIAFLSGITPVLEEASNMGTIHRIMLRGPDDDNLTVFVEQERSLGVSSSKAVSVPALSQKIEDMLQWV
ncbi:MAG TPA: hypothetical protein EYG68_10675 [Leucothrix mucor]|nr:hypothetical protein [Leucothrix mucor]